MSEFLKILRFRFRRKMTFRPSVVGGALFRLVDGKLRPESEVLTQGGVRQQKKADVSSGAAAVYVAPRRTDRQGSAR